MSTKPVLLLFIDWFSPGYKAGGPIVSCINFIQLMKDEYDIYVLTSDTDLGEISPYKNITSGQWLPADNNDYKVFYTVAKQPVLPQIRAALSAIKPDFVYLNHLFSPKFVVYPLWLTWKGIIKCKVIVCPRGALYESALSVKPYKKMPFMKLFKWMGIHKKIRFHATSQREKDAILHYFPGAEVMVAHDLPDTKQPAFKTQEKRVGELKCIFIARIHPIKNLLFLLQLLKEVRATVALTIIGPVEDADYWKKCELTISELPAHIKVAYGGSLPNHALLPLLQQQHLFVLPTQGENFGHSIFESLLAGRPVLISDQTPWLQLTGQQSGWDLPLASPQSFVMAIETAAGWDQAIFDQWCRQSWLYAKNFIDNPNLKKDYRRIFS